MQIFETDNDIAKIEYNPSENNLVVSDFLLIEDQEQKIIAQIINTFETENSNKSLAEARLALSIDEDENISYYNGFTPSKDAIVIYINPSEILSLIKEPENNLYIGNLSYHKDCFVNPSYSLLNEKLYIQSDRDDKIKILIQNLISELHKKNKKVILLDFDGRYNSILNVNRLTICDNLRLPLNIEAFKIILEEETNTCPLETKAVIESIINDICEYISTLKTKYIPFSVFKNVIDEEFKTTPGLGLKLIKDKLETYAQTLIFAEQEDEFKTLNNLLSEQNILIIDASNIDEKWHKLVIETILDYVISTTYLVVSLNELHLDEKTIANLYNVPNIIPVVSTNYESPIREQLKVLCKNNILFKPAKTINDKENYMPLLNKINSGDFIICGNSTLYLSFIIELQSFDNTTEQEIIENEIKQEVDNFLTSQTKPISEEVQINNSETEEEEDDEEEEISPVIDNDINNEDLDFLDNNLKENNDSEQEQYNMFEPMNIKSSEEDITSSEVSNETVNEEDISLILDETDDIINLTEENQTEENISTDNEINTVESILDSFDNAQDNIPTENYENTNKAPEIDISEIMDNLPENSIEETTNDDKESLLEENIDEIIEEINDKKENKENELPDNSSILETNIVETNAVEENTNTSTPNNNIEIEPDNKEEQENIQQQEQEPTVYETDNSSNEVSIKNIPFKIGDKVYHPKHGNGVIEGFANYSNKIIFCQIEFENVGRRILDPRISGLQKIS